MANSPSRSAASLWGWLAILALVGLVAALSWHFQKPISFHDGFGWDGVEYARVAEQLAAGQRPRAEAPFLYRVGTPALAAWLSPGDLMRGFRWVNGVAALLAPLLLFAWLGRQGLRPGTRLFLAALLALQWHAPLRLTPFYPVHVDPLMWLFWLGALLLLERSRGGAGAGMTALWCLWAAVALAVREVLLLPALALAFSANPLLLERAPLSSWIRHARQRIRPHHLLPVALGLLAFLLIRLWAQPTTSYGFLKSAVLWLWLKSLPHYLHGLCQAFGPLVLVLLAVGWRGAWRFLAERQDLLVWLAGVLALGWVGGADTERLLFWGAPLVLLLAGRTLEELFAARPPGTGAMAIWLGVLVIAQALSQRLVWLIPDYPGTEQLILPLLTPLSSAGRYLDLWSQHARPDVAVLSLAQYVLVIGLGVWWGRQFRRGAA